MVKNLKKLRNERGISQQALAQELGITQQSVNKYENHKIEPDITTLIVLANYFGVTVDYLIGRTDGQGNNLGVSKKEEILWKYSQLKEKEKQCVNQVIETFFEKK